MQSAFLASMFGSVPAEDFAQPSINLMRFFPGADCEKGDSRSRESLLPATRQKRFLVATTANENNFPREVMLEALVRFVDWDLGERKS